jgi:hypothetical protein
MTDAGSALDAPSVFFIALHPSALHYRAAATGHGKALGHSYVGGQQPSSNIDCQINVVDCQINVADCQINVFDCQS